MSLVWRIDPSETSFALSSFFFRRDEVIKSWRSSFLHVHGSFFPLLVSRGLGGVEVHEMESVEIPFPGARQVR